MDKSSKPGSVSNSALVNLIAERNKRADELRRKKNEGSSKKDSTTDIGDIDISNVRRPGKRPSAWETPKSYRQKRVAKGKGKEVASGNTTRDEDVEMTYEHDNVSMNVEKQRKEIMRKKAERYNQLKKGNTGGLTKGQFKDLAVDFDRKVWDEGGESYYDQDSNQDTEEERRSQKERRRQRSTSSSSDSPNASERDMNEEMVEYTDEFGRTRTVAKSQVPRSVYEERQNSDDDNQDAIYGDQESFPIHTISPEEIRRRYAETEASNRDVHYDADKDIRTRGANFYRFSKDEEERKRQIEELKEASRKTDAARAEATLRQSHLEKRTQNLNNRAKKILEKKASVFTKYNVVI